MMGVHQKTRTIDDWNAVQVECRDVQTETPAVLLNKRRVRLMRAAFFPLDCRVSDPLIIFNVITRCCVDGNH